MADIRFIAVYEDGFGNPFTSVILGRRGLDAPSHSMLAHKYEVRDLPLYAGYLRPEENRVVIAGGSTTLAIPADAEKDRRLALELERMLEDVIALHARLETSEIGDAILAP